MFNNKIKILGAFGAKTQDTNNTCIQINNKIIIDAGNILNSLGKEAINIEHIFLSHSHLDHIVEIPFLIDHFFDKKDTPINIYALGGTIEHLKNIFSMMIYGLIFHKLIS
jgi:ribonuclease BN (tRNA processing enzyme)